jgi:hypothetical protein
LGRLAAGGWEGGVRERGSLTISERTKDERTSHQTLDRPSQALHLLYFPVEDVKITEWDVGVFLKESRVFTSMHEDIFTHREQPLHTRESVRKSLFSESNLID